MAGPGDILVVEDSPDSVVLLTSALVRNFPGVRLTLAGSIREFHSRLPTVGNIDLAVVDLGLPDGRGHDIIEIVRKRWPATQILVYTLFDDDHNLFEALTRGAGGYLLKYDPPDRLSQALQRIMAGEPPMSPKVALRVIRWFNEMGRLPNAEDIARTQAAAAEAVQEADDEEGRKETRLTPRELETLTLTAKGLRLPELAQHLGVTRSTAATYLKRIYRKLDVSSRAEATTAAIEIGLIKVNRSHVS